MKTLIHKIFWLCTWRLSLTSFFDNWEWFFCFVFNIYKHSKNSNIRYDRKKECYVITESLDNDELLPELQVFLHKNLRTRASNYFNGITYRAHEIASIYGLDKVIHEIDNIVLDCGCNLVDLLQYFIISNKLSLIYIGFEPGFLEYNSSLFTVTYYRNSLQINATVINSALGSKDQESRFYYSPAKADSSIIKPLVYSSVYTVSETRLDSAVSSMYLSDVKIDLLKLEAEGFEPEIIQGASASLRQVKYVLADLGPERGIRQECTFNEVHLALSSLGFSLISFNYPPRICFTFKNKHV